MEQAVPVQWWQALVFRLTPCSRRLLHRSASHVGRHSDQNDRDESLEQKARIRAFLANYVSAPARDHWLDVSQTHGHSVEDSLKIETNVRRHGASVEEPEMNRLLGEKDAPRLNPTEPDEEPWLMWQPVNCNEMSVDCEYGVFTLRDFLAGDVIECCAALPIPEPSCSSLAHGRFQQVISNTHLGDALPSSSLRLLPLGWGMLYRPITRKSCTNEICGDPNAAWRQVFKSETSQYWLELVALRLVASSEEIRPADAAGCIADNAYLDMPSAALAELGAQIDSPREATQTAKLFERFGDAAGAPRKLLGPPPGLCIGSSSVHGRGVFAERDLRAGEIVEVCPALPLRRGSIHGLHDYEFDGGFAENPEVSLLALGYGSLYNHRDDPNVAHGKVPVQGAVRSTPLHFCQYFVACQEILKGEELFIKYGMLYWLRRSHQLE